MDFKCYHYGINYTVSCFLSVGRSAFCGQYRDYSGAFEPPRQQA